MAMISSVSRNIRALFPAQTSLPRHARSLATLSGIKPETTQIHKTTQPKSKVPNEKLTFGTTFTDHMLEIDWTNKEGWLNPVIKPYGNLSIDPASSVLHYALECFEGMKAYVDEEKNIRLFRPELNMKRMNSSMSRLQLPTFESEQFLECIKQLIRLDKEWIPEGDGYSLYIRPTGISTHPFIGVGESAMAKLFVILSPVGPYYPEGFNPVKLLAEDTHVRAWPGGSGNTKIGGNYGPTIMPQVTAAKRGYSQVLWLFGDEHLMTEVGTMNLFIFWKNENGEDELVTPPLDRGDILPGVTRQSILELAREWNDFKVSERTVGLPEVHQAVKEGRLHEIFGSGTAAVISPVSLISYQGEDIQIPLNGTDGKAGKLAERIWRSITDIQYGRVEHPWSVVI